jgi:hypothetical protein
MSVVVGGAFNDMNHRSLNSTSIPYQELVKLAEDFIYKKTLHDKV